MKIVSEGSIGSNLRRLEAVTGLGPIDRLRQEEELVARAAEALGTTGDDLPLAAEKLRSELKARAERDQGAAPPGRRQPGRRAGGRRRRRHRRGPGRRHQPRRAARAGRSPCASSRASGPWCIGGEPEGGGVALVAAATQGQRPRRQGPHRRRGPHGRRRRRGQEPRAGGGRRARPVAPRRGARPGAGGGRPGVTARPRRGSPAPRPDA